ncbi:unnamed protein product [Candida verbasci]|uniref:Maf-like protein n=1 Tax=Candida verbasci TaxID=1227364 RepID=A0A9W4XCC8_9ASCO|nr:unnamed protein product [Candida verbasci]
MTFNHPLIKKLEEYQLILGSKSQRRKEILINNFGITNFVVVESQFDENLHKNRTPLEYVQLTSKYKAINILDSINKDGPPTLILTCDTIIACNDKIFEKPITKLKQREYFNYFKQHRKIEVISALTLIKIDNRQVKYYQDYDITKLQFRDDDDDDDANLLINSYIESEEGLQVAGGFKYQGKGCLLFKSMVGDYLNVVGLPSKTFDFLTRAIL